MRFRNCMRASVASIDSTHNSWRLTRMQLVFAEGGGCQKSLGPYINNQWLVIAAPDAATAVRIVSEARESGCMCQQRL